MYIPPDATATVLRICPWCEDFTPLAAPCCETCTADLSLLSMPCPECGGEGCYPVQIPGPDPHAVYERSVDCLECDGEGEIYADPEPVVLIEFSGRPPNPGAVFHAVTAEIEGPEAWHEWLNALQPATASHWIRATAEWRGWVYVITDNAVFRVRSPVDHKALGQSVAQRLQEGRSESIDAKVEAVNPRHLLPSPAMSY